MDCIICGAWFSSSAKEDKICNACLMAMQRLHIDTTPERMMEITQAERAGRLVVLPCNVGDTVYRIWATPGRVPVVTEHHMTDMGMVVEWMPKFGKTVFLTRPEAEAALELKKREDGGNG